MSAKSYLKQKPNEFALAVCILLSVLFTVFSYFLYLHLYPCNRIDQAISFYQSQLRGNLFAGFLSVGGFLMALKTFIVIKLKENVYDNEFYNKRFEKLRRLQPSLKLYSPLENISNLLFWATLSAIVAAFAQFTFGLFENDIMVFIAIFTSILSGLILIFTLFAIKASLNHYFQFLNEAVDASREKNSSSKS